MPLALNRTYNTLSAGTDGPFGFGWTSSYGMSLRQDPASGRAIIAEENGSELTFHPDGSGGFVAPSRVLATLSRDADGRFTFTRRNRTAFVFSAAGKLSSQRDLNGHTTTFAYDAAGQLTTVTDPAGRRLTFTYGPDGRVRRVTDPVERAVSFTYDGAGDLVAAVDVAGGTSRFVQGSSGPGASRSSGLRPAPIRTVSECERRARRAARAFPNHPLRSRETTT